MRLIATKTIELAGILHTPGTEFDVDDAEGKKLVRASKAERKDGAPPHDDPAEGADKH